jgi:hypothetical protein
MQVFPLILVADKLKAMLVASMTTEIERLNKKRKDVRTVYSITDLAYHYFVPVLILFQLYSAGLLLITSYKQNGLKLKDLMSKMLILYKEVLLANMANLPPLF